jgi:SAM-dependent methyltransferase
MCGSGRFLLPLLSSGIEVEGVDAASAMLQACRRHAQRQQLRPVLYEQSIEQLALPRQYGMAFVPSGSMGLLEPPALNNALLSLRRHLAPGAALLLEIMTFDDTNVDQESLDARIVQIDKATRIVYRCQANASGNGDSIRYDGRYEKWHHNELLEVELESLVLWKHEPAAFLQLLRDCGYVRQHIVEPEPYGSLRGSGCVAFEAFVGA